MSTQVRLDEIYRKEIRPQLLKEGNYKNVMEVPSISKVVINVGSKEAVADSRIIKKISDVIARITGQLPVRTIARKSIASFKIREGMPLGVKVTLRGKNMYEFLDRFINLALPKVKDFQGLKDQLDGRGNYNIGVKEWSIFPEADSAAEEMNSGLNITIHTTARNDQDALELLKKFGMPFSIKKHTKR
ncbi:MAG: 50S ribosomal protein L5 [Candidatus Babeliales bacterium]